METPAAAPIQSNSDIRSDIAPQPSSGIAWITFSGSPGDSSGDFIQAIQRVAFQQGHARDDHWIADYAAACFNGDALHWYSELDDETQESWKKLRTALLKRYPAASPGHASSTKLATIPTTRDPLPGPSLNAMKESGLIQVLRGKSVSLGYLCLDSKSVVGVTKIKADGAVINLPSQMQSEPVQLSLDRTAGKGDTKFRNLGLGLLECTGWPKPKPDQIPEEIQITKDYHTDFEIPMYFETGIPTPSALCKPRDEDSIHFYAKRPVFATWILTCCEDSKPTALHRRHSATKDPSQKAAAAVWKYEKSSRELRMSWLMDDDTYVQRNPTKLNLHVHRVSDMQETGRYFDEDQVRFVFHPTQ
ncbi:hypothetical protein FS837_004692 [Tulasnella sp. UAMH 9824]|nr:hypothetical protein FS837_004692 [Tulasnella sp. UAMH 9824]